MKILFFFICLFGISSIHAQQENRFGPAGTKLVTSPPDSIVSFPDKEAEYPGGFEVMNDFIFMNFIMPDNYMDSMSWNFDNARIYVSFIVERDGTLSNVTIEKGYDEIMDSIAVSIVNQMPKWTAAQKNGLPVRSLMRIPINIEEAIIGPDLGEFDEEEIEEEDAPRRFGNGHFSGFDIYMSQFMNGNGGMQFENHPYWENNEVKSIGLNYNVFDLKFPIAGEHLGITTGLGVGFQSYSFQNNYVLQHTADTIYAVSDTIYEFSSNKLQVGTVSIPLFLDYSSNVDFEKSFYVAAGFIGTYNYGSKQRLTGTYANGDLFDNSTISNFNMNRWTLDATVRLGYGHFGMFVSYQLNPMFQSGHTIPVYPFRIGFNLLFGV